LTETSEHASSPDPAIAGGDMPPQQAEMPFAIVDG
jgi:hypothetical protein